MTDSPTTEIIQAARHEGTVATLPDSVRALASAYPALDPTVDIGAMVAAALGEDPEDFELRRSDLGQILLPSGTALSFEVPDRTVKRGFRAVEEFPGIPVHMWRQRGFWLDPNPTGKRPDCAAADGRVPVPDGRFGPLGVLARRNPGHVCKTCPMSQFKSARNPDGSRGLGQACKESLNVLVLRPGSLVPVIFRAPATSMGVVREFMVGGILDGGIPPWGSVVQFSLEKAVSKGGEGFAKVVLSRERALDSDELARTKAYRDEVAEQLVQKFKTNPESMSELDDSTEIDAELWAPVDVDVEPEDESPATRARRAGKATGG